MCRLVFVVCVRYIYMRCVCIMLFCFFFSSHTLESHRLYGSTVAFAQFHIRGTRKAFQILQNRILFAECNRQWKWITPKTSRLNGMKRRKSFKRYKAVYCVPESDSHRSIRKNRGHILFDEANLRNADANWMHIIFMETVNCQVKVFGNWKIRK